MRASLLSAKDDHATPRLARLPNAVTVRFSAELEPDSKLTVDATGCEAGSGRISSQAAIDPSDPERRSLIVSLPPMARTGTYSVDWRTKAKGGRAAYGGFYFAVGMPTPGFLKFREYDSRPDYDFAPDSVHPAILGGLFWIAVGVFGPLMRRSGYSFE